MPQRSDDHELITRYFLGVATSAEREAVEVQYFGDESAIEALLQAEDEIIDDYVRYTLTASERKLFEKNFLCTAARRKRMDVAQSLMEALADIEMGELPSANKEALSPLYKIAGGLQKAARNVQRQRAIGRRTRLAPQLRVPHDRLDVAYTQDSSSNVLEWLDPVRAKAAEKYEIIRNRLVKLFASKGCVDAEELADETMNRVSLKLPQLKETYVGDPARYFYGVARLVILDYQKRQAIKPMLLEMITARAVERSGDEREHAQRCLDKCLLQLSEANRGLILQYYGIDKKNQVADRKALAESLGVSSSSLQIRLRKIRVSLQKCLMSCVEDANDLGERTGMS